MGYGVHRFIEEVDENLICGICSAVLEDAVLTPCGHSFCQLCLTTWLARPGPGTCPECRGKVSPSDGRPILSLRNLINALEIHCEHSIRGCDEVVRLECLASHLDVCSFSPIECAGCGGLVDRGGLSEHHIQCDSITSLMQEHPIQLNAPVADLACRVAGLEIQVDKIKGELQIAHDKNKNLEVELSRTKEDLVMKRNRLSDQQFTDFDPEYDYGYTPSSIVRLACLIARFLLTVPQYVNTDRVYEGVKKCYDNYGRCNTQYELDVLMLLATANASNWFNKQQKVNIQCWLQCLNRFRQYKNETSAFR